MLTVLELTNPFDFHRDEVVQHSVDNGQSIYEILTGLYPGFTEFEHPTICLVNGRPWCRNDWTCTPPTDATVTFVRLAEGVAALIIAVVVAVVAVAVALLIKPQNPAAIGAADAPGQQQNGDTVYSLSGQKNQVRLNSAIEAIYGRNRLYPSYAAEPYSVFDGNQEFEFSLFCLGHGSFAIDQMRFEDTALQAFDDVEFEIVEPGNPFTLFADNVATSAAVAGIELFGPNEDEYTGYTGAFTANAPFTKCTRIEVDIALPAGLYQIDEHNKVVNATVEARYEYQAINDVGHALGPWTPMIFTEKTVVKTVPTNIYIPGIPGTGPDYSVIDPNQTQEQKDNAHDYIEQYYKDHPDELSDAQRGTPGHFIPSTKTVYTTTTLSDFYRQMNTVTPQRFTLGLDLPLGRYQVRAVRVNNKITTVNSGNTVRWDSLRAFFPSTKNYGDVTLVAVKARATNSLNNNAAQRFNVIATRKLPAWNTVTKQWSLPALTRNPVWAFCDVFRATYGGRLPGSFLDVEGLSALAAYYDTSKITFDYIFDQKTTVWEAARAIGQVGRAVPMLDGSRITLIRDRAQSVALAIFNQHNILAGSLTWSIKLPNVADYDGIEVQYTDPETWDVETVVGLLSTDAGNNPEQVKLPGCTSRTIAYQEGLYRRAVELYCKEQIRFKTGLEGFLPRYGDLILVSHDVPRWGQGGLVTAIDGETLTLNEEVTFTPGAVHRLVLRNKDGTAYGPLTVTPGSDAFHVTVSPAITQPFNFNDYQERPYYLFGVENLESKRCVVTGITPESEDVVEITAVNYDDRVFGFSAAPTPAKYAPAKRVVDPPRPVVLEVTVSPTPQKDDFVQISWAPALGARNYVIEQSVDQVNWTRIVVTPNSVYELRVDPGQLYLRVAGVNTDIGPWSYWQGRVGDVAARPANVTGFRLSELGPGTATVAWNAVDHADRYELGIYDRVAGIQLRNVSVNGLQFTYTLDDGDLDGLTQTTALFRIKGVNLKGKSEDASVLYVTYLNRPPVQDTLTADNPDPSVDNSDLTADHA